MEEKTNTKKPRKPLTERQAFLTWAFALVTIGMGFGVALVGLHGFVLGTRSTEAVHPVDALIVGALVVFIGGVLLRGVPASLKPFERFSKDKTAVSPVIAVVLMVAITVVLAAVVFVLVSDISGTNELPPTIGFRADGDELLIVSVDRTVLWESLAVSGCAVVPVGSEKVDAGDRVGECAGDVAIVHRPSNTLLYSSTFGGA